MEIKLTLGEINVCSDVSIRYGVFFRESTESLLVMNFCYKRKSKNILRL